MPNTLRLRITGEPPALQRVNAFMAACDLPTTRRACTLELTFHDGEVLTDLRVATLIYHVTACLTGSGWREVTVTRADAALSPSNQEPTTRNPTP